MEDLGSVLRRAFGPGVWGRALWYVQCDRIEQREGDDAQVVGVVRPLDGDRVHARVRIEAREDELCVTGECARCGGSARCEHVAALARAELGSPAFEALQGRVPRRAPRPVPPPAIVQPAEWVAEVDEGGSGEWFGLALGVIVDGERFDVLPAILGAIKTGRIARERLRVRGQPLIISLPDGRALAIAPRRLQSIVDVLLQLGGDQRVFGDRIRITRLDAPSVFDLPGVRWIGADRLRSLADALRHAPPPPIDPPRGLRATLRDYQRVGVTWLQLLREHGLGGILADDMGLGKTIQALAHVLVEREAGRLDRPCLVVAPRSVLHNWAREAERFVPALRVAVHHGSDRDRDPSTLRDRDLVITTWALLVRDEMLRAIDWHIVVLDEAQMIKNTRTKVAAVARSLRARQRILLTGTPMENHLGELHSLMSVAVPGLLGSARLFASHFRTPIERHADASRQRALTRRIAPFVLRRTKAAVLTELPPKTEIVLHAELTGAQRDLYEAVRLTMQDRVRQELRAKGLAQSTIVVLDALLKLRQVCCHPPLAQIAAVPESAKLDLFAEVVQSLRDEGRTILVFSQFTRMLDVIGERLHAMDVPWLSITGKTKNRQAIVDRFQRGECPVLLVSLKAGGTGLNLTAADAVIHYDPWWNPAVRMQATDRAHRIGQRRPITVVNLICEGTVEERMLALQHAKAELGASLHGDAERRASAGLTLDADDIATLLAPLPT